MKLSKCIGKRPWTTVSVAIIAILLGGQSVPAADSSDGGMKPGTVRRGPDGKLYLDTSEPAPAATPSQTTANPPPPPTEAPSHAVNPSIVPTASPRAPRTITVCGSGCDATAIGSALQSAQNGDIILIKKGLYGDGGVLRADHVTIRGEPGAHLKGGLAEGKAAIVVAGHDTVVDGLECSEIAAPDHNGACLRMEGHTLTVRNVHFHDAEEGILTAPNVGVITIEDSSFERLGANGLAHAIYCGDTEALIIRRSKILSSRGEGHEVKSRAARTVIEDSVIASLDGLDSRALDVPNGGEVVLRNSLLEKGLNSSNGDLIGFGLEGVKHAVNSLTLDGVTAVLDRRGAVLLNGAVRPVLRASRIIGGDRQDAGIAWFPDRAAAGLPPYPALPGFAPSTSTTTAAKPKVKRVCAFSGSGCDYTSLNQALREAETGGTVILAPGPYAEAGIIRANHVTLRAEPGARMTGVAAEGKAALVIKGDDTVIEALECSGISVPDRNGACIRLEGRNLTLRKVYFHDSESGLLANDDSGDITIEDSRFERLGSGGRAHGIYVNKAKTLTLRHTTVTDTTGKGHGVKSRAARTVIERSVIATQQGQDSRLIDTPNGGEVIIRDCVLEKGPASDNVESIGYGLEGITWPTNSLVIENSTFIMDRTPNALARSAIGGHMRGGRVVAGDNAAIKRGIGKLVDAVLPGKIGDNLEIENDVQWLPDRASAGLPAFPALPKP